MHRVVLNKKHPFDEVVDWMYANLPKDDNDDRWSFYESIVPSYDDSFLSSTKTEIVFKNEIDSLMFTLRWS